LSQKSFFLENFCQVSKWSFLYIL